MDQVAHFLLRHRRILLRLGKKVFMKDCFNTAA